MVLINIIKIIPRPIFFSGLLIFLPAVENTSKPAKKKKQELKALINPGNENLVLCPQ